MFMFYFSQLVDSLKIVTTGVLGQILKFLTWVCFSRLQGMLSSLSLVEHQMRGVKDSANWQRGVRTLCSCLRKHQLWHQIGRQCCNIFRAPQGFWSCSTPWTIPSFFIVQSSCLPYSFKLLLCFVKILVMADGKESESQIVQVLAPRLLAVICKRVTLPRPGVRY